MQISLPKEGRNKLFSYNSIIEKNAYVHVSFFYCSSLSAWKNQTGLEKFTQEGQEKFIQELFIDII